MPPRRRRPPLPVSLTLLSRSLRVCLAFWLAVYEAMVQKSATESEMTPFKDGTNGALKQWFTVANKGMQKVQKKLEKRIKSK